MIVSVGDVTLKSFDAYYETTREKWVLDWPGQVVLTTSVIAWTKEVREAIDMPPNGHNYIGP